jgi:asparagine N-glycosylation enzyme membrane subunit Stt3
MDVLRSIGAVVGGYLVMMVVVILTTFLGMKLFRLKPGQGQPAAPYLGFNLASGLVAAVLGGWTAAWVAPAAPMAHVGVLAVLVAALGLLMARKPQPGQPRWYPVTIAAIGTVGVLAGGLLYGAAGA